MNLLRRLFERELLFVRRLLKIRRPTKARSRHDKEQRSSTTRPRRLTFPPAAPRPQVTSSGGSTKPAKAKGAPVLRRRRRLGPALMGALASSAFHALIIALLLHLHGEPEKQPRREPVLVTIHLRAPPKAPPEKPRPVVEAVKKPQTIEVERPDLEITPPTPTPDVKPATDAPDMALASSRGVGDLEAPSLRRTTANSKPVLGVGDDARPSRGGEEGTLLSGRGQGKAAALQKFGGTPGTENAVSRGLFWLAAHQEDDGSWDADGFQRHCESYSQCLGKGKPRFNTGITALATLAFLGAGHQPGSTSVFSEVVRKALNSLLAAQNPDGSFGPMFDEFFYNHAVATLAIVEGWGLHRDARYLRAATRALEFSARGQQPGGAWDYTPEQTRRHDLSVTGWQVLALRAAQELEIPFDRTMMTRIRSYLRTAVHSDGTATYANRGIAEGRKGINMVAVGMLSQLYVGVSPNSPSIRRASERILRNPPDVEKTYDWLRYFQSTYYWYSATLAMFQIGGEEWGAWNHFLQQTVLPEQNREPHEDGSWEPDGNWLGVMGGRITSTALNVLTLEVYYRYPPLHSYRRKPTTDDE